MWIQPIKNKRLAPRPDPPKNTGKIIVIKPEDIAKIQLKGFEKIKEMKKKKNQKSSLFPNKKNKKKN